MSEESAPGRLLNNRELLLTLQRLCKEKRSGVMVINSESGSSAKFTLDQGVICDVLFKGFSGKLALLQIRNIQQAKAIFVNQTKVTALSALELTNGEIFQILEDAPSTPTAREAHPISENVLHAPPTQAPEDHTTVIEAYLAVLIGPVARVVYREFKDEVQRTESIDGFNLLIEKIARQALRGEQQNLFKQALRQYMGQQGFKASKLPGLLKSSEVGLKSGSDTLRLFITKHAAQGELGQGLLSRFAAELETVGNLAGVVELIDVLKLLEKTTKTASVEIQAQDRKGFFYFENGVLINARSDQGHGVKAAIELLQWHFDFMALFARPLTGVSREIQQTAEDLARDVSHLHHSIISKEEGQKYLKTDKSALSSHDIQDALAKEIERLQGRIISHKEEAKPSESDTYTAKIAKAIQLAECCDAYVAEQVFSQVLLSHDDNFNAWFWLSRTLNNMTAIEFALKKAAGINPKSNELAEEIKKFTAARKNIKTDFVLRCPFCWMEMATKDSECPHCESELYITGDFFDKAGKAKTEVLDKAIARYGNALQKDPASAANVYLHFYLAMAYLNRKYYQEGLEQFDEIVSLAPENKALAKQAQILTAYMKSQGVFVKQPMQETPGANAQTRSILVVEDSQVTRKVIARTLLANGYEVFEAKDADEALFDIEARKPDLVLLDIILPGKDGYEILAEIRQKPGLAKVPVIMLTSRDSLFDKLKGKVSDANEYLTKPFQPDDLIKIVKKYLK